MADFNQTSFNTGEIGRVLQGRRDFGKSAAAVAELRNFIIHGYGGLSNSPGTTFVGPLTNHAVASTFKRFSFADNESYILEFNEKLLSFVREGGYLLNRPRTISAITQAANPLFTTSTAHGLASGERVYVYGATGGMLQVNLRYFIVTSVPSTTTFRATTVTGGALDSTAYTAGVSGHTVASVYTIATPYTAASVPKVNRTQSADVMTLTSLDYAPMELTRTNLVTDDFADPGDYTKGTTANFTMSRTPFAASRITVYFSEDSGVTYAEQDSAIYTYSGTTLTFTDPNDHVLATNIRITIAVEEFTLSTITFAPNVGAPTSLTAVQTHNSGAGLWHGSTHAQMHITSMAYQKFISGDRVYIAGVLESGAEHTDIPDGWYYVTEIGSPTKWFQFDDASGVPVVGTVDSDIRTGTLAHFEEWKYKVTAVDASTGEESLPTSEATITSVVYPDDLIPVVVAWSAPVGEDIEYYRIYRYENGYYGYIGKTEELTFDDANAVIPNVGITPPASRTPFADVDNYPAACTYFQQRRAFGGTRNQPALVELSQTSHHSNMSKSTPQQADDSITFTVPALDVNQIKHMFPYHDLIIMTSHSEVISTSGDNAYTVVNIRNQQDSNIGIGDIPPLLIERQVLFVQARGDTIVALGNEFEGDPLIGGVASKLAPHLFEGDPVKSWAYAQRPESIVWIVHESGALTAMTYLPGEEVWGFAPQNTAGGKYESVEVASEGSVDVPYFAVRRTIGGNTVRYMERQHTRYFADQRDAFFVHCGTSLDSPKTVYAVTQAARGEVSILSHGFADKTLVDLADIEGMTKLNNQRVYVANAKTNTFEMLEKSIKFNKGITAATQASEVVISLDNTGDDVLVDGDVVWISDVSGMTELNDKWYLVSDATTTTMKIKTLDAAYVDSTGYTAYTSGGIVDVHPSIDTSGYTAYTEGGTAREAISVISTGLDHLEGETVSILSDASVEVAQVVTDNQITLPTEEGSRVHAGIGIESYVRTLELDTPDSVLAGLKRNIGELVLRFDKSKGMLVGTNDNRLTGFKSRESEGPDQPSALISEEVTADVTSDWDKGHVIVKQTDPLPVTILAIGGNVKTGGL